MIEVGSFEAKNNLSALLLRAEAGEEILITRRGKPVAQLVPPKPKGFDIKAAMEAGERIRKRSENCALGGLSLKDLINEGRK